MKVLVYEPHAEVRALLGHVVERLGHEAVYPNGLGLPDEEVDALLLEPADPDALAAAEGLRARNAGLPIVCASIDPDYERAARLTPVAYLLKPFGIAELEQALGTALSTKLPAA